MELLHVLHNLFPKFRAFEQSRIIHLPLKIIGYALINDGVFNALFNQVGRYRRLVLFQNRSF